MYKVQFTRYFEEFGLEDCDTMEFDNLKEASLFYELHKDDSNVQLWVGTDRLK